MNDFFGTARVYQRSVERWLSGLFCLISLTVVAYSLSDYSINWTHPEIFIERARISLDFAKFNWYDLARFFDCLDVNQCGRSRFLSYLIFYFDSFFRAWLIRYAPPHPSLSLTWFLSFASLYCLYRFICDLTKDRTAALLAVGLYALSPGFLSMILMLFNPAKPLAGFFVNFCLCVAARIWKTGDDRAYSVNAIVLYASLFLAFCSDETAWVLYGAIPVFFPELFRRRHMAFSICFLSTFPLFLIFVTWVAPFATKYFWQYQSLDFWGFTFNFDRHTLPGELPLLERFRTGALFETAYNMLASEYAWTRSGPMIGAASLIPLALGIFAAVTYASRRLRSLLVRAMIVLVLFVAFEGLLMLRHSNSVGDTAPSTFYYGALFSNFSLILVGFAISCFRGGSTARTICILVSIYLSYVSFTACMNANRQWMAGHEDVYASWVLSGQRAPYGPLTPDALLTKAKVAQYWQAERLGVDAQGLRASFSPKDAWLFEEMDAWFCSARACCLWPHREILDINVRDSYTNHVFRDNYSIERFPNGRPNGLVWMVK